MASSQKRDLSPSRDLTSMSSLPDFTKLTVPQLKALCKDKRITGYSKLTKAALVEKLNAFPSAPTVANTILPSNHAESSQALADLASSQAIKTVPTPPRASTPSQPAVTHKELVVPTVSKKRPAPDQIDKPAKKPRAITSMQPAEISKADPKNVKNATTSTQVLKDPVSAHALSSTASTNTFKVPELPTQPAVPKPTLPKNSAKRFKPLTITAQSQSPLTKSPSLLPQIPTKTPSSTLSSLRYLEFNPSPEVSLSLITKPPSIAQRKRVQPWALILSGISDAERRKCVLVSKMIRYAGTATLFATGNLS